MILIAVTDTDFGIGAVVIVVIAFLIYRVIRRDPLDRIVRLGVFIERQRFQNGEQVTERKEWPERKEGL